MQAWLHVTHQRANLTRIPLLPITVVGRSVDCHLKIATTQVSRRHCQISIHVDGVYVEDLASANGTYLDGVRLTPGVPTFVHPGGRLNIGPAKFIVDYVLPPPRQRTSLDVHEANDLSPFTHPEQERQNDQRYLVVQPTDHQPALMPQPLLDADFAGRADPNWQPSQIGQAMEGSTERAYPLQAPGPLKANWLPGWWKEKQATVGPVWPR